MDERNKSPARGRAKGLMFENDDDQLSIVALEHGAKWPAWLGDYPRLAPNAVVVAQTSTEPAAAFLGRIVHRLADARSVNARVSVGVVISAPTAELGVLELRERMARAILKAMGGGEAELVLTGDAHAPSDVRHELFGLAGRLCEELSGSRIVVKVRFAQARSGVVRAAGAPPSSARSAELQAQQRAR